MKLFITLLVGAIIGLLGSCSDDGTQSKSSGAKSEPVPEIADRTVLAYIAADNTLTDFSLIDLREMIEGVEKIDTRINNMLVYIDRNKVASALYDRAVESHLIRICREEGTDKIILDTLQTYDTGRNSVSVDMIREVVSYAFDYFPAKSNGLIMWSHGEGWLPFKKATPRWIGQDTEGNTKDQRMNIDDLRTALQGYLLDYLLFDACYMESIEVAYELRDCADYIIGSPTEIPGPGAPYQEVVPCLFAKEGAAEAIAKAYFEYYDALYNGKVTYGGDDVWVSGVSVAVLRSNKLDALAEATRQLPLYTAGRINTVGVKCYDPLRNQVYYDFDALIYKLVGEGTLYRQWKNVYNTAVTYYATTPKNMNTYSSGSGVMVSMTGFTGVSSFIFANNTDKQSAAYYKQLAWYRDTVQ